MLRPAHTPGLIAAAVRNSNQGVSGLRFFELGRVFRNTGGGRGRDIETDTLKGWINDYESTRFTDTDSHTAVITSEYNMECVKEWLQRHTPISEMREF